MIIIKQKRFDKIKSLFINLIKVNNLKTNKKLAIIYNGKILKAFTLKSRTRQEYLLLPLRFNTVWKVLNIRHRKKSLQGRNKTVIIC